MGAIQSVTSLEGYRILVELKSGSSITIDLSKKIKTARYAELASQTSFQEVTTDGETVFWRDGLVKAPLYELIDVAVGAL